MGAKKVNVGQASCSRNWMRKYGVGHGGLQAEEFK